MLQLNNFLKDAALVITEKSSAIGVLLTRPKKYGNGKAFKGIQRHIRIDVKYGVAKGIGKTSCDAISDLLASVKKKMKEGYEPPNGDFSIVREGDLFVAFQSMRKRVKVYEDK